MSGKNRKLIVKPQLLTWDDAKKEAAYHCGRLLYPLEIETWAQKELINVDIWLDYENENQPDYANYYDGRTQNLRYQPKTRLALLVILADGEALLKKQQEAKALQERGRGNRRKG